MTEIRVYGYLSKILGKQCFKVYLGKLNYLTSALEAIIPNFRKIIFELKIKGFNYEVKLVKNIINIIPSIIGFGRTGMKILGFFFITLGVVLLFLPGTQAIGFALINAGVQLLTTAYQKRPKFSTVEGSTGGLVASIQNSGKSYIFSNENNLEKQGSLIPIGYGLVKTASSIISASIKNYKFSDTFVQENIFRSFEPESTIFL